MMPDELDLAGVYAACYGVVLETEITKDGGGPLEDSTPPRDEYISSCEDTSPRGATAPEGRRDGGDPETMDEGGGSRA